MLDWVVFNAQTVGLVEKIKCWKKHTEWGRSTSKQTEIYDISRTSWEKATKLHIAAVDRIFDGCVIANLSVRRIPTPAPVIVNKTKPTVVRTWTIHWGFGWNLIITSVLTYSSPLNMKKAKVFPTNPDICQLFVTAVSEKRQLAIVHLNHRPNYPRVSAYRGRVAAQGQKIPLPKKQN